MMTLNEFRRFRDECNLWITSGMFTKAQSSLMALRANDVPASALRDLCNLYRRAHLWKRSLMILRPRVYPRVSSSSAKATAGEKIEYALALQRAGAHRESLLLLSQPGVQKDPQSLIARAFSEIFQWNYERAAPLIHEYLASGKILPYENYIARVNLLACWASFQAPEFAAEFESLKKDLRASGHLLLLGAALEIGAQYMIVNGHSDEGERALREAEQLLKSEGDMHLMFVNKWRAIAESLKTKSVKPLDAFRQLALTSKHWETLRDLDYFRAMLEPDSHWAGWVYFGTPYTSFRKRMEQWRSFPEQATVSRTDHCVQVVDPWFAGDQHGEMSHLLLNLLLRDFYRPMKVGEIFSELFWGNHLDLTSSQDRIHQLIRRLRSWITEHNLAFTVVEVDGAYAVRIAEETGLVCRQRILPAQKLPFIFGRFQTAENLTAKEWGDRLNMTTVKARNLLAQAVPHDLVQVKGKGPATRYKIRVS